MKRILIMAGGTGGHVFPGLALAASFKQKGIEVAWLGTLGGMEKEWVEKAQIDFYPIRIKGLRGNGLLGWLKAPINVLKAWMQARQIIKHVRPDVVLGMGGFVCGPGGLAARSLGIDLALHEQNAIVGLTNRWLAPFAKHIITAFPQNQLQGDKVVCLGNPVREGLEAIATVSVHRPLHLLVLGGSRGALALNKTVPQALALMPESKRPVVIHQTGTKTLDEAQRAYQVAGVTAKVVPFIDDMVEAYEHADLVVCRSGALTVSELMASARPAIMIPFPFAVDDHQTANAEVLAAIGGGEVIQQTDLTPDSLVARLQFWQQDDVLKTASEKIRAKAPQQAKEQIVELLINS
ncbi:undecaprenyldiphospho-muramoylpentapeptide beta-N-acetylglucosaminyltransferase [Hydrogenovibrio marinus]|uniref:UDP-N-acetylglucosamine--N-acetylmuramyl-(pentapeptide) pyrophosphoryl-undecaprenol N-acetylglucosamine transferase n=1 Tax=Hydrogenovibrio marinus TaxID=28885 RepID=A0A066ZSR8_HYDMR|nr:undecaprenyldiphospho-muramoylpentapeptide beta-N-acetylglucosaminyltransferase [Hydrogenovibrio marinus]KDN96853.1 UDP-N-acetylglucosamine--N-acetylmuramyl-(pentapeptide) pyrophosphoryl-UDP N-acetylglucosamine transferase [Hydrogenovibrio marinus]BBN59110.1 UDP-N-acetylglucosamine--N-acetylmuramyl-(pentapeptide) pyrophosphoryl-undecaprenol N-acetylglucosamine transferase [Hydrogenovibrio marinus]